MIADTLKNCEQYYSINPGFKKGFEFIEKYLENELPDGRYEIDGENVYALVQSYETVDKNEIKWEAHRKYIDVQFIASGRESIGWTHISQLKQSDFNEEKDFLLFEDGEGTFLKLQDGWFTILFPEDAHKPKCRWDKAEKVKKIVLKVKV